MKNIINLEYTEQHIQELLDTADSYHNISLTEVMEILDLLDNHVLGRVGAVIAAYKIGFLNGINAHHNITF